MSTSTRIVDFTRTKGRLPAWLWRDFHTARDNAGAANAVLVVDDGPQSVVVMALDNYNAIIEAIREEATHGDD